MKTFKLKQSGPPRGMSRADDPYHNVWAESFWTWLPGSSMKTELRHAKRWLRKHREIKVCLFEYIYGYNNIRRLHSSLNYLNPVAFEAEYYWQNG